MFDLGIRLGVAKALEAHRKAGEKVAIWQGGRSPASEATAQEDVEAFCRIGRGLP